MSIPQKAIILIKPNFNSDDPFPATSNPETILAIIEYVKKFNPKTIIVADASFIGFLPTKNTMKKTGAFKAIKDAGAEVIGFEEDEFISVLPKAAKNWNRPFHMAKLYLEADFVINQPVIKTHKFAGYSISLKNTIGAIMTEDRPLMHRLPKERFKKMTAELNLARPVDFIIIDGQKVMVTGGPFSGKVKQANLIIATKDPVAADATGLAILKSLGTVKHIQNNSVWEQPVLKHAVELGLGANSKKEIKILSSGIDEIKSIEKNLD